MSNRGSFSALISKKVVVWRRELRFAPLFPAAIFLASCASLEQTVPIVASAPGESSAMLAEGRTIYTHQCTACHSAEPVSAYSAAQWRQILPDMNRKSKLTPEQGQAVETYVFAALNIAARRKR